jgi:hypothetical protein
MDAEFKVSKKFLKAEKGVEIPQKFKTTLIRRFNAGFNA